MKNAGCFWQQKFGNVGAWAPNDRKWVLIEPIRSWVQEVFQEIAQHHGLEIAENGSR